MRIRKGHRCLPMALPDRSSLQEGLVQGEKHPRMVADDKKAEVNQASLEPIAPCAVADTSRSSQDQLLDLEKSTSSAGTERLEVDRGRERSSTPDEESGKRTPPIPVEWRISISSIIRAGAASVRNNLPSVPASAQSVVTSDTSVVRKGGEGCSPCVATKSMDDQPAALLESLKRVCSAVASTGLTAKEAVGKIRELCLPGLNEGGERLIVQVAKAFRSSSAFAEREERGRYFVQDGLSPKVEWGNLDAGESKVSREKGSPDDKGSAILEAMEAARQLQSLQRMQQGVAVRVGSASGGAEKNRAGGRAAVTAVRSKSGASASSSGKASASWEHHESGPRCNRDDGKGWRCFRPAEAGFSLCKYHRDQIRRAELRRRRSRNKAKEQSSVSTVVSAVVRPMKASNPSPKGVGKGAGFREGAEVADGDAIESDEGVPDRKRRRFVKAKSLKSIL